MRLVDWGVKAGRTGCSVGLVCVGGMCEDPYSLCFCSGLVDNSHARWLVRIPLGGTPPSGRCPWTGHGHVRGMLA